MKINLITAINSLGYGIAGVNIASVLQNLGYYVSLFPIGNIECSTKHIQNIKSALYNRLNYDVNAPCIRIWHQHDLFEFVGHGKHIGFPIFELDTFTELELASLANCDQLFVCSHWAKNIIEKYIQKGENFVKVVPLGVDGEIFSVTLNSRKPTVFCNIGKLEKRKGHDVLVNWFNKAFTEDDDVELWLMIENPFYTQDQMQAIYKDMKSSKLGNKIKILHRVQSQEELSDIMQYVDCGVFPARAEGWNLDLLELLSCGKHCVTTNYSAHTEFCSSDAVRLVDINETEPAHGIKGYDDRWFYGQGNWGKLDQNVEREFIEHMQHIHALKQKGILGINYNGVEVAKKFSWKNTVDCIVKHTFGE